MARHNKQASSSLNKRLIGYIRVSTEEQVLEGNSIAAQEATIRAFAQRHGHILTEVITDAGVSGTLPPHKRAGLRQVLAGIAAKKADGIVFCKLDRLSRKLFDILKIFDAIGGANMVSCDGQIDTTHPMGEFQFHLMGALGQYEVKRVSDRVKHGLAHLTRIGRVHTPRTPWGFRLGDAQGPYETARRAKENGQRVGYPDKRPLVENPAEQAILQEILRLLDAGHTPYAVAKKLNTAGVVHPRGARCWLGGTVESIQRTALRRMEILSEHHAVHAG